MSIARVQSYGKVRYRVRYRVPGNPNPKTRTFDKKRDAVAWEEQTRFVRRNGTPLPTNRATQTLAAFGREYLEKYGQVELAPATLQNRRYVWNKHVLPALGDYMLWTLVEQPDLIQKFKTDLIRGGVGEGAVSKTLSTLSAVLGKAVEWNRIPRNPAAAVKKGSKRKRPVEVFSPQQIEALRDAMPTERDRLLVALLAYTGCRPGEAIALTGADIRRQTIIVSKALVDGADGPTKTRRSRSVRLLKPLADDLKGCGPGLLFTRSDGRPWREHDVRNWRNRVWQPAVAAAGFGTLEITGSGRAKRQRFNGPRPYDLRHSFASLLLAAHENPIVVAAELGHGPKVLFDTYAHVIADLQGQPKVDPDRQIRLARRKLSRVKTVSHASAA